MLLLFHIFVALGSMAWATLMFLKPSKPGITVSYGLITATLASGSYLILTLRTDMLRACLTGLFYVAAVSVMTLLARQKLAGQVAREPRE